MVKTDMGGNKKEGEKRNLEVGFKPMWAGLRSGLSADFMHISHCTSIGILYCVFYKMIS